MSGLHMKIISWGILSQLLGTSLVTIHTVITIQSTGKKKIRNIYQESILYSFSFPHRSDEIYSKMYWFVTSLYLQSYELYLLLSATYTYVEFLFALHELNLRIGIGLFKLLWLSVIVIVIVIYCSMIHFHCTNN